MAKNAFRQMRGGGGLFAELRRQPLQVSTMHCSQEPPEPARCRPRGAIPEARGQRRLGRRDIHQDGASHQGQFGQPMTTVWSKDKLTCCSQHLLGRQGEPFHGPTIAIECLQMSARQRQRRVQEERLIKTRVMDQHGAEGRCARPRIRTDYRFFGTFQNRAKVVDSLPDYTSGIRCRRNLTP